MRFISSPFEFFHSPKFILLFFILSWNFSACQSFESVKDVNQSEFNIVNTYSKILADRHIDLNQNSLRDLVGDEGARVAVSNWLNALHEDSYVHEGLEKNMFMNWCFLEPQYVDFEIILGLIETSEDKGSIAEIKRNFDQFYDQHFDDIIPDVPAELDWTDKFEVGKYVQIAKARDQADFQHYFKLSKEDRIGLSNKFSFRAYQARTDLESCAREAESNTLIKQVLEEGWPLDRDYGKGVSNAFWLLVQHQDHDLDLQKHALQKLEMVLHEDSKLKSSYAYLTDRIASNQGLPQIFGTQVQFTDTGCVPRNLSEPITVDERRLKVGLEPIREYLLGNPGCDTVGDF